VNVLSHKFLSVLISLSAITLVPPMALSQPSFLKGLVSTSNYQVFLSKTGSQYIVLEGNQVIFLPGAGAGSSPVAIMTGPMGSRWYTDKNGQKQNLPQPQPLNQAQASQNTASQPSNTEQSSGSNTSGTTYPSSVNVTVPYGVPIYTNPSGYQYYTNPTTGQPVYISPTANVYNPAVNYGTTTNYPTTGTTSGTTTQPTTQANIPSSGTINTNGSGYVETPQGTASYDHTGSTTYGNGQVNSNGQTSFETPKGQTYETGHGTNANSGSNTQRTSGSNSANSARNTKSNRFSPNNNHHSNGSLIGDSGATRRNGFRTDGPLGGSGHSGFSGIAGHSGHNMPGKSFKGMGGMHKPSGGGHASFGHKGGGRHR
jgi:hypothetical protein